MSKYFNLNFCVCTFLTWGVIICDTATSTPEPDPIRYLDFSVITDPKVRQYAEEFNSMCPHTYMCDVLINFNESLFQQDIGELTFKKPCCGPCFCETDCFANHECCPDKLPRLLTNDEVRDLYNSPLECVQSQFRPFLAKRYSGKAYQMVTKCSSTYYNKSVKDRCWKEYSDFDFVTDIPEFLPVTDSMTMITYKNKHCAVCNHVSNSAIHFWDISIGSGSRQADKNILSLSDMKKLFEEDMLSNAVFLVPPDLDFPDYVLKTCSIYIDRCNVTGLWNEYDPEMESMCVSYLSPYKDHKNVHCYLCNGYDISTINEICEEDTLHWQPSSFATLLDFNDLEKPEEDDEPEQQLNCQHDQIYDEWLDTCRSLTCPDIMLLVRKRCQPVFKALEDLTVFDVTMRLVPLKGDMDYRIIPILQESIFNDAKMITKSISDSMRLGNIQMFIKLNETIERYNFNRIQQVNEVSYRQKIKYIAVRIIISVIETENLHTLIEDITNSLYGLNIDVTGGFTTEFANISFKLYENHLEQLEEEPEFTGRPPSLDPNEADLIFDSFTDPLDGLGILAIFPPYQFIWSRAIRLFPFLFCPMITLSENEFHIEHDREKIYLKNKNTYLNTSSVVFFSNDSSIFLCSTDYLSNNSSISIKQNLSQPIVVYNTEVIVSIVCTSISLLSLFVVFAVYCSFKILRTLPGINNMALVFTLFFAQLFYLVGGVIEITQQWLCEVLGLLLHLSLGASFFWMGVCTFHMMRVFACMSNLPASENTWAKFIKYAIFVAISSVILVAINITVSFSDNSTIGYGGIPCYIKSRHMILYTVAVPLGFVIICNLLMFIYVIIKISRLPDVKKNTQHERRNIVIFAKLSTLTGLTWIFAYLYQWTNNTVFAYLFIIANASQGLFITFSFIVNRRVYNMLNASYRNSSLYQITHKTKSKSETGPTRQDHEGSPNTNLQGKLSNIIGKQSPD